MMNVQRPGTTHPRKRMTGDSGDLHESGFGNSAWAILIREQS